MRRRERSRPRAVGEPNLVGTDDEVQVLARLWPDGKPRALSAEDVCYQRARLTARRVVKAYRAALKDIDRGRDAPDVWRRCRENQQRLVEEYQGYVDAHRAKRGQREAAADARALPRDVGTGPARADEDAACFARTGEDLVQQLSTLAALHAAGDLTDEQYEVAKTQLLG